MTFQTIPLSLFPHLKTQISLSNAYKYTAIKQYSRPLQVMFHTLTLIV